MGAGTRWGRLGEAGQGKGDWIGRGEGDGRRQGERKGEGNAGLVIIFDMSQTRVNF